MRWLAPLLVLLAAPSPAAPTQAVPARLGDGRTLAFRCAGAGSPTILFESGWAADGWAWSAVLGPVSKVTRACAYDRAGAGGSSPGPLPRDGQRVAADLAAGLKAARIPPPYVIVAHSAGALYARAFTQANRSKVAGLLLVDPTIAHQQRRLTAAAGQPVGSLAGIIAHAKRCLEAVKAGPLPADDKALAACAVRPPLDPVATWQTRLSEVETLEEESSGNLDGAPGALGALPLVILAAMRDLPGPAGDVRRRLLAEEAAISRAGRVVEVADSGHMMMRDRPDAITGAVVAMVEEVRRPAAKGR